MTRSRPAAAAPATESTATTAPGWLAPAAVLAVLLMWASAFIAIRAIGTAFGPGELALGRLVVGTVVLVAFAAHRARRTRAAGGRSPSLPRGRGLALVIGYGVLWFAAYTVLLNLAERHLDAGTAAMLVNIGPVLVAVGAGVLLREGFPRQLLLGIAVAFVGVAIIAAGGRGGHSDGLGIVLGVVTAVLYAAGVLTQKVALRSVDAVTATWLGCAIGAAALLGWAPSLLHQLGTAGTPAVLGMVYLGVFPTAAAFALWAWALRRSDAGRLTSATMAVPAIVVFGSWWLLGETPTTLAVVGGAIALSGVAISRIPHRRRRAAR